MKPQTLLAILVAGGAGLAAMLMTQKFLRPQGPDESAVLVAIADIEPGTSLNEAMFKSQGVPRNMIPEGAVAQAAEAVGRAAKYHLMKGEVITEKKLAPKGVAGLQIVIEEGMRAVAVPITTDRAVAGFVKAGDRVDILLTTRSRGVSEPERSKTILQDIKVLTVNQTMQNEGDPENKGKVVETVSFLLTPVQAELLQVAQTAGALSLTLRGKGEDKTFDSKGASLADVMGGKGEKDASTKEPDPVLVSQIPKEPGVTKEVVTDLFKNMFAAQTKKWEEERAALEKKSKEAEAAREVAEKEKREAELLRLAQAEEPARAEVPKSTIKRLTYRNLQGDPLMEIYVDAESKIAESLRDLLEEVEPGELEKLEDGRIRRSTPPEAQTPKKSTPKQTTPKSPPPVPASKGV